MRGLFYKHILPEIRLEFTFAPICGCFGPAETVMPRAFLVVKNYVILHMYIYIYIVFLYIYIDDTASINHIYTFLLVVLLCFTAEENPMGLGSSAAAALAALVAAAFLEAPLIYTFM